MASQKLFFNNQAGTKLAARLELPLDQAPHAYAIFAHCFTCGKNLSAVRNIARNLTQKGFGVLRFDFTGLGDSEGEFAETNFSSNIQDIIAAADFMTETLAAPKLLVGHSLGGAAVIFAGKMLESVEAVATIGAPSSPDHVQHLFQDQIEEIQAKDTATVSIAGRTFTIQKQFLDDISGQNMITTVKSLRKALLILHSPQDRTVGIQNAAEIYKAAMHPKSFVSLNGADHLLSDKKDSLYVGEVIASWASRYIPAPEIPKLQTRQQVVAQIGQDGFTTEIKAGKHHLRADEPISVGGNDYGPNPYEFLLTALGTCTVMTLRMYINRKKWNIPEITVHLTHSKAYAKDFDDTENSKAKIDLIERNLEIKGNIDEAQRKRLLQIADKCPVHKTLEGDIKVQTAWLV